MITDSETNLLYLSDCLKVKKTRFFKALEDLLVKNNVPYKYIPKTKDIWAVDYMPIQVSENKFVQFNYSPDYLKCKKYRETISDVSLICELLQIKPIKSNIILDGGNIVRSKDKVIMCDKIFHENKIYSRYKLRAELESLFEIDNIYFVPQQPNDIIGHADGMVRFYDEKTLLINNYSKEDEKFQKVLYSSLDKIQLEYIHIPYNPYLNKTHFQANGTYINYLQMKDIIILPFFGLKEDKQVFELFTTLFKDNTISTINCNEIAREGGVLNCISWNIYESFS